MESLKVKICENSDFFVIKTQLQLLGVIDLVSMKQITWDVKNQGQSYKVEEISDIGNAIEKRLEIIDSLSGIDDQLAEAIIANDSLENVNLDLILNAIRRQTINRKIVPILLGSAYKKYRRPASNGFHHQLSSST